MSASPVDPVNIHIPHGIAIVFHAKLRINIAKISRWDALFGCGKDLFDVRCFHQNKPAQKEQNMSNVNQGYSSKSTAIRGAKRANLIGYETEQREDGKWYIVQRALPPGTYDATISSVKVDETTGKVAMDINVDGVQVTSTIATSIGVPEQNDPTPNEELVEGLEAATPQPELDDATKEKIAELHKADAETTLRLAAKFAVTDPYIPSTPEQIEERRAERREKHGIPAPVKGEKSPSYKEMARSGPEKSEIEKPVQYIHAYLAEHYGKRSRKELIAELVAKGINVATCRTQYQHFKRKLEEGKAE